MATQAHVAARDELYQCVVPREAFPNVGVEIDRHGSSMGNG